MGNVVRSVWTEPKAAHPPAQARRDWALVAMFVSTAVLEAFVHRDVVWRPVAVGVTVALAFTLPWRRTHPLAVVAAAFGAAIAVDLAAIATNTPGEANLYTTAYLLLLPYALFRWGSGREAVIGSGIALAAYDVGMLKDHAPLTDWVGGFVILLFTVVLGLSMRFWATARLRQLDQVRSRERELLARELHDTVAHHVSAMVIRAQAGRVVAQARPGAAIEALEIIEAEGSRTLAEMRTMVGALRGGDDAELAPLGGIADIERLARSVGDLPSVQVSISGVPADVSAPVDAALYRIAQEAITNVMRHARHASRIVVQVTGQDGQVRLTVRDDGDEVSAMWALGGYGIVGMTERATLLGGSLKAGPGPGPGWVVEAVLPAAGSAG